MTHHYHTTGAIVHYPFVGSSSDTAAADDGPNILASLGIVNGVILILPMVCCNPLGLRARPFGSKPWR